MTNTGTNSASHSILTRNAQDHPKVFESAFNSGQLAAVLQVYEQTAIFAPQPGLPTTGESLQSALTNFLALGLPIEVTTRHCYEVDDVALLIVDWRIQGPSPDGSEIEITGTATDVARRGLDGNWRYLIDNPFGGASQ